MIGVLCEHYHWSPGFWRQMGWRELRAWIRERARSVQQQMEGDRTSPGSWDGAERDPFWVEQNRKRKELRGY